MRTLIQNKVIPANEQLCNCFSCGYYTYDIWYRCPWDFYKPNPNPTVTRSNSHLFMVLAFVVHMKRPAWSSGYTNQQIWLIRVTRHKNEELNIEQQYESCIIINPCTEMINYLKSTNFLELMMSAMTKQWFTHQGCLWQSNEYGNEKYTNTNPFFILKIGTNRYFILSNVPMITT